MIKIFYGGQVLCAMILLNTTTQVMAEESQNNQHHHPVQSVEQRLEKLAQKANQATPINGVSEKISMSAVIEVEAGTVHEESPTGATTNSKDISLATTQLGISATISPYVTGQITLLYEEGEENGHVTVDEGIISISGNDHYPFSVNTGKMYVPFGNYDSHFISDPLTLVLGETNDTAIMVAYETGSFTTNGSLFNSAIHEINDDQINSFTAGCSISLPAASTHGLSLNGGLSYISNLATTDTLLGEVTVTDTISETIGGWSIFASLVVQEKYSFYGEFLTAMNDFSITDFSFSDAANQRPTAWNLEAGAMLMDDLELALRYSGSNEVGTLLAETQYGVALLYDLFNNTSLTLEYLSEDFSDNSSNGVATVQLAIEF